MTLLHDIRFALRTLGKSPGFTIVAITALALGIGANTAAFTLTNSILFEGFPFDKSDRILYVITKDASLPENQFSGVSYPDCRDWRAQAKSFDGLTAYTGERITISDKNGLPESYLACQMNANGFRTIGQRPSIGRDFDESDDAPGVAPVAILKDGLWQRRYGADPNIIGQIVRISGRQTTVIGVMPRGFAETFSGEGPHDNKGRSLRQFDLQRRLMRYPCSYMIYSNAFDSLPSEAKEGIYGRMWQILSGKDKRSKYARLSLVDRQAIVEVLNETKKGLPEYFQRVAN